MGSVLLSRQREGARHGADMILLLDILKRAPARRARLSCLLCLRGAKTSDLRTFVSDRSGFARFTSRPIKGPRLAGAILLPRGQRCRHRNPHRVIGAPLCFL